MSDATACQGEPDIHFEPLHDVRGQSGDWYSHWYKDDFIHVKPEAWQAAGAADHIVKQLGGVSFSFKSAPPSGVELPNHKSWRDHEEVCRP
jgi:hypothetical protein